MDKISGTAYDAAKAQLAKERECRPCDLVLCGNFLTCNADACRRLAELYREAKRLNRQKAAPAPAIEPATKINPLLPEPTPTDSILVEAESLTEGARNKDYGHPLDDYTRTAALWSAILGHEVTPSKAILCMAAVKISRECNSPKRDNRVDGAGYFKVLDMAITEARRRGTKV